MKTTYSTLLLSSLFSIFLIGLLLTGTTSPIKAQTKATDSTSYIIYEVKPKDTVYSIAHRNGLKESDIYRLNPGSEKGIQIGQKIRIPQVSAPRHSQGNPQHKNTHIVLPGETLYAISRKYNIPPAILKQYNPDINPDVLRPGMEIRIALSDGTSLSEVGPSILVSSGDKPTIKVALLLPLELSTGKPDRYLRFYEGFLMALYKAKESGVSIDLDVYSTPNKAAFKNVIHSGGLSDRDVIFGGQEADEVSTLAKYTTSRGIIYVSPFISSTPSDRQHSSNMFKLNSEQRDLYPYIASAFCNQYRHYTPLFLSTTTKSHESLVTQLKKSLRKKSIHYLESPLLALSKYSMPSLIGKKNVVIILDDSRKEYLTQLLTKLKDLGLSSSQITIFGYPEWQSYDQLILQEMETYKTTIYSSFFYDAKNSATQTFANNYKGWYNKRLDSTFPRFSLLGYDAARFFITAFVNYGTTFINMPAQVPGDGLQTDFIFRKAEGETAFSNMSLFFVTFKNGGKVKKERIVF